MKLTRGPGRDTETRLQHLEEDLSKLDDRVTLLEEKAEDLRRDLDALPTKLEPFMRKVADEQFERRELAQRPVRLRGFLCLLVGVPLSFVGSLLSLWA